MAVARRLPGLLLMAASWPAPAGDVEDVAATARQWAETIGRHDPDAMVLLHDEDAVQHNTRSPSVRQGHAVIREYGVHEILFVLDQPRISGAVQAIVNPVAIY